MAKRCEGTHASTCGPFTGVAMSSLSTKAGASIHPADDRANPLTVPSELQVGFPMNNEPSTSAGKLAAMFDYGWTLCALANFFNIELKEVEHLIVEHVRQDREERSASSLLRT
jgi:hypothetical protein